MGRRPSRAADSAKELGISPDPVQLREHRRAKAEMAFEDQSLLGPLFGQFDANLVQVENRLGVFISARGDRVVIEGPEDSVARARDVLQSMYDRLAMGQDLDAGAIDSLIAMSNEPTLEGIISRRDVVAALARSDREIEDEIRSGVIDEILGLRPDDFDVVVHEGIVLLAGTVADEREVVRLERLVGSILGVSRVDSKVTAAG